MVSDIRLCKACGIDFVPDHHRQEHCLTKACKRDRDMDNRARLALKTSKGIGYNQQYGKDPTKITPNSAFGKSKRTRKYGKEDT